MQERELINAVSKIELNKEAYEKIYRSVRKEETMKKKQYAIFTKPMKYAAAVVAFALLGFSLSFPVRALVDSFTKERMEALPEEFIIKEIENINMQEGEAQYYSREYTSKEIDRMSVLYDKYNDEGLFPEKELPRVANVSEAGDLELYFVYQTGFFQLPERELTDEELLELIDYDVTQRYVIQKNYEKLYADEIDIQNKADAQNKENVKQNGGISEYQAIEIATNKLQDIYGLTPGNMEQNSYLVMAEENVMINRDSFCVNWTDIIHHKYYYFFIDANTGEIYHILYSSAELVDLPAFEEEAFATAFPEFVDQAKSFLQEKMNVKGDFSAKGYIIYQKQATSHSGTVELIDNNTDEAYIFTFSSDGKFEGYTHMNAEEYQERLEELKTIGTSEVLVY